jgi:hypothetical protein
VSDFVCYCGRPADELHHPTARVAGDGSPYLDEGFRVPACHDDHALVGDDQRRMADLEPDLTRAGATILDRLEARLRRVAAFVGRVGEAIGLVALVALMTGLATHLERWANELGAAIAILDSSMPGWRTLPGIHG